MLLFDGHKTFYHERICLIFDHYRTLRKSVSLKMTDAVAVNLSMSI